MNAAAEVSSRQTADLLGLDHDLQLAFPERPCLLRELVLIPYRKSDLIILGTEVPRLVKCQVPTEQIVDALALLDGTRSIAELKASVAPEEAENFYRIQTLLFRYGMLEDGPVRPVDAAKAQLVAFLGRHVDNTRHNRNRGEALQRLQSTRLAVFAEAAARDGILPALEEACLAGYAILSDPAELTAFAPTFVLAVCHDPTLLGAISTFCYEQGVPCLFAEVGTSATSLGPLFLPGMTASYECSASQAPPLKLEIDPDELLFWTAFVLQECLLFVAGLNVETYINQQTHHHHGIEGRQMTRNVIARLPGTRTSGLEHAAPLDRHSSAFVAWRHHCGIRFAAKEHIPPKVHQRHYAMSNILSLNIPVPPEYGTADIIDLPRDWNLPENLPWLRREPESRPFDARTVGDVLRTAVGTHDVQRKARRVSPTGGGLQSSGLFARLRKVGGIKDGWFSYDPNRHALEELTGLDDDLLHACLPLVSGDSPLVIVIISKLRRTCEKYGDMGYNIVQLDAGVTGAFATVVGEAFGWRMQEHTELSASSLAYGLGLDVSQNHRIVSGVLAFAEASAFSLSTQSVAAPARAIADLVRASAHVDARSPRRKAGGERSTAYSWLQQRSGQTLEETFKARRATLDFADQPVDGRLLRDLVKLGHHTREQLIADGAMEIPLGIVVLRPIGDEHIAAGAFDTSGSGNWEQMSPGFSRADLRLCINQNSLVRAAALLVIMCDLEETLHRYGAAGYRHLLNQAGALVGRVWLAASAAGLVGTAAGGVLDDGLRRAVRADGYSKAAIFGFALGEPVSAAD